MRYPYGRVLIFFGWLAATGLPGCGTPTVATTAGGGISGTGVVAARGAITGFGSVFVNGTEYFTDSQTIFTVNGVAATETDLSIGMVVDLVAMDDGSKTTVDTLDYAGDLRGPVESVDPRTGTLVVLGQTVNATNANMEGHANLEDFSPGEIIEVSGHRASDGTWQASYLELESDPPEENVMQLEGVVRSHDAMGHTFFLGLQMIDYDRVDMGPRRMNDGQKVLVKGTLGAVDGVLVADSITFDEGVPLPGDGGYMELEGFVTHITGPTRFSVDGTPVDASGATFIDGSTADLHIDVEVEVEGRIRNGMFVADRVEFDND